VCFLNSYLGLSNYFIFFNFGFNGWGLGGIPGSEAERTIYIYISQ
jgi:hypothetical protein